MSNMSQFAGGGIKSIQRGVLLLSSGGLLVTPITVSSVNTSKSRLALLGTANNGVGHLELSNSTTINAVRNGTNVTFSASWELTEHF